jgi:adenine deaminase
VKILLAALVLFGCLAGAQEAPTEASIRHVTVINVATGAELKDQTVKIQGERIVSIAATQEADAALPGGVDAHGGFLIPGLWGMHIHVHEDYELSLYVANGVTGAHYGG